jgi:hypothetical protein
MLAPADKLSSQANNLEFFVTSLILTSVYRQISVCISWFALRLHVVTLLFIAYHYDICIFLVLSSRQSRPRDRHSKNPNLISTDIQNASNSV